MMRHSFFVVSLGAAVRSGIVVTLLSLAACSIQPYRPAPPPGQPAPPPPTTPPPVQTQPATPQEPAPPAQPLPPPVTRTYTLNAASRSLVTQARAQLAAKNFAMAASTIERALRIEPNNPLLWLEYAQVRLTEGNHAQAESMGRKALALASGDPRTQANAWRLISESLLAQNKTTEARQAEMRANSLSPR